MARAGNGFGRVHGIGQSLTRVQKYFHIYEGRVCAGLPLGVPKGGACVGAWAVGEPAGPWRARKLGSVAYTALAEMMVCVSLFG